MKSSDPPDLGPPGLPHRKHGPVLTFLFAAAENINAVAGVVAALDLIYQILSKVL